jgi:hypothetical protein
MSSRHSCCQQLTGPEATTFVKAQTIQLHHIVGINYVSHLKAPLPINGLVLIHAASGVGVHGPPGPPASTISVLRI